MFGSGATWNPRAGLAVGVLAFLVFVAINAADGVEASEAIVAYTYAVVIGAVVAALASTGTEADAVPGERDKRGMPTALIVLLLVAPVRYGALAFDIDGLSSSFRETTVDVFVRAGVAFALVYAGSMFTRRS